MAMAPVSGYANVHEQPGAPRADFVRDDTSDRTSLDTLPSEPKAPTKYAVVLAPGF